MIKEKPHLILFFIGILFLISSFFLFRKNIFNLNIHATYYVIRGTDLLRFSSGFIVMLATIYFIMDKLNINLNQILTYIHLLTTIFLVILIIYFFYKIEIDQNKIVNIFEAKKQTDYNLLLVKTLILIVGFQILLILNIIVSLFKHFNTY